MKRSHYISMIDYYFQVTPIVALLGPRQCGKTTLALEYAKNHLSVTHFDLEDPIHLSRLDNPMLALQDLEGLIIIDEVQLKPHLFPVLRVMIDRFHEKQRYLILGSASRDLIQHSSETLAGRISYFELTPFTLSETNDMKKLWIRGGFPRSYLSNTDSTSMAWRQGYIQTFLERDIPNLGIRVAPHTLRRFWMMLLGYHGNILNTSDLGRSLGFSSTAINHYLDILSGTFMMRILRPWFENISKRQVKSPKLYFRDSGIMHALLGVSTEDELHNNAKLGASWEGFALEEVVRRSQVDEHSCYFWSTHSDAELDLIIFKNGKRLGFEFKYLDSPKITKSIRIAMDDLNLDSLTIVVPTQCYFFLDNKISVSGLDTINFNN
ncbi:TPA: ATP-binding protein [Legionella pneumophila]|nr:ATP-binding protein [Legionella pneumophila]HAU1500697.1 ATP-binding protein [Legionella pneumophila]HAU1519541.1 ATP-binding protein [Legionella pneumophila]